MNATSKTNELEISVECTYDDYSSTPESGSYIWGHRVRVKNLRPSPVAIQTISRTVANTRGQSFIENLTPNLTFLKSGQAFQFNEIVNLDTPAGALFGSYQLVDHQGIVFSIDAPSMTLTSPHCMGLMN